MSHFVLADRKTDYLLPPSVDDWLTQDHLARFVVEVIDQLDLSNLTREYAGRGSKAYHPATLLAIIVYGYATGVFSSRRLETATYDSVAFRYIAAGSHPDHDTLATFRRRFIDELAGLFVQVTSRLKMTTRDLSPEISIYQAALATDSGSLRPARAAILRLLILIKPAESVSAKL